MTQGRHEAETHSLPYKGMACPACGYDLTGTIEPRCPECGGAFDPSRLRVGRSWWKRKPRGWVTLVVVLLAVYLPNTWIFWIDYPWGDYRLHWVKLFPALPVLLPGGWCYHFLGLPNNIDQLWGLAFLGGLCACLIAACYRIGRRSVRALVAVAAVVFALEVFNAWVSHALFRM